MKKKKINRLIRHVLEEIAFLQLEIEILDLDHLKNVLTFDQYCVKIEPLDIRMLELLDQLGFLMRKRYTNIKS